MELIPFMDLSLLMEQHIFHNNLVFFFQEKGYTSKLNSIEYIGLAATFNRELVKQVGSITAKDTRLVGIPWAFSPILDLATEPRWARVYEVFFCFSLIFFFLFF